MILSYPLIAQAQPAFEPAPGAPVDAPIEAAPAPPPVAVAPAAPRVVTPPRAPLVTAPDSPRPWAVWVMLAALGAGGLGLTQWLNKKRKGLTSGEEIQVVAQRSLSPKHQLVLVAVRQRELLLAIGENGTTLLTEVGNTQEVLEQAAHLADDFEPELTPEPAPEPKVAPRRVPSAPPSAAVSGLLALKARLEKPLEVSSAAKNSPSTLERDTEFGRRLTAQMLSGRKS